MTYYVLIISFFQNGRISFTRDALLQVCIFWYRGVGCCAKVSPQSWQDIFSSTSQIETSHREALNPFCDASCLLLFVRYFVGLLYYMIHDLISNFFVMTPM